MKYEEYVARCQAIAKIGKKFSHDPYALENYEELEKISGKMMSDITGDDIVNIFEYDVYPTPSSSVRVIVFDEIGKLLMVQEKQDGNYAVPGGWCEVFDSLQETAIKEVKQESGLSIEVVRLLAIFQRERYKDYPTVLSEQVHYFLGKIVGGEIESNHEILSVGFKDINNLPELSKKNSRSEVQIAIKVALHDLPVYFD